MINIQKMIEEEAEKYANSEWESQEVKSFGEILGRSSFDIEKLISENDFKAGAHFALSQLQHANRWRKVSEGLPELEINEFVDVLVKNIDGDISLFSIITTADIDTIKNNYAEWRPIE